MQMLKKDLERLRRLDPKKFAFEIKQDEEHLKIFQQKALVK